MDFELTRGDTHSFKFRRKSKNGTIISDNPINIWFTVKSDAKSHTVKIQKRLSNRSISYDGEYYRFTLFPSDTNELEIGRTYKYDIEVKSTSGVHTISKGTLSITEEVTHAADEVMDDG